MSDNNQLETTMTGVSFLMKPGDMIAGSYGTSGRRTSKPKIVGAVQDVEKIRNRILEDAKHIHLIGKGETDVSTQRTKPAKARKTKKASKESMPVTDLHDSKANGGVDYTTVDEVFGTPKTQPEIAAYNQPDNYTHVGDQNTASGSSTPLMPIAMEVVEFKNKFGRIKFKVEGVLKNAFGLALVYSNAESIVFTPEPNEDLICTVQGDDFNVFYTGVTFTWLDGVKQIMVLVATHQEE